MKLNALSAVFLGAAIVGLGAVAALTAGVRDDMDQISARLDKISSLTNEVVATSLLSFTQAASVKDAVAIDQDRLLAWDPLSQEDSVMSVAYDFGRLQFCYTVPGFVEDCQPFLDLDLYQQKTVRGLACSTALLQGQHNFTERFCRPENL